MKSKILAILLATTAAAVFAACSDKDAQPMAGLNKIEQSATEGEFPVVEPPKQDGETAAETPSQSSSQSPPQSQSQSDNATPPSNNSGQNTNADLSKETVEKYYDYVENNPQIITLVHGYDDQTGFSDYAIARFVIIYLNNNGYDGDYDRGFSTDDFDAVTEKFFGKKVAEYNNYGTDLLPDTNRVVPSGWDISKIHMVLNDMAESNGVKTATFYTLYEATEGGLKDSGKLRQDLLSGNFKGYGTFYMTEMKFIEKYDPNGNMYFEIISMKELYRLPITPEPLEPQSLCGEYVLLETLDINGDVKTPNSVVTSLKLNEDGTYELIAEGGFGIFITDDTVSTGTIRALSDDDPNRNVAVQTWDYMLRDDRNNDGVSYSFYVRILPDNSICVFIWRPGAEDINDWLVDTDFWVMKQK